MSNGICGEFSTVLNGRDGGAVDPVVIPGLSPAEYERLALLAEECGEVIQIIGKILRHGYESRHPDGGPTNRELLERELGDVDAALRMMFDADDIIPDHVDSWNHEKQAKVRKYLHHQG